MSRRIKRTETDEEVVEILALAGCTDTTIAEVIGVAESTLKVHYAKLLTECRKIAIGKVAGEIYQIAMLPIKDEQTGERLPPEVMKAKTALLTFLAKTRLQWRETTRIEHEGLQNVTPVLNLVIGGTAQGSADRSSSSPQAALSTDN